ncbi:hypothetical protein ACH5RR_008786 [Cinchona calisaya]|uniref:Uncharacterized protein n=1 Tax=Cinchona calisaya TaxID=153742 RepID=A0ABD3ACQ8_9GENT
MVYGEGLKLGTLSRYGKIHGFPYQDPSDPQSVRRAYHLAMNLDEFRPASMVSGSRSGGDCVEVIWHLAIPPDVNIFIWRTCKIVFPPKVNAIVVETNDGDMPSSTRLNPLMLISAITAEKTSPSRDGLLYV